MSHYISIIVFTCLWDSLGSSVSIVVRYNVGMFWMCGGNFMFPYVGGGDSALWVWLVFSVQGMYVCAHNLYVCVF